MYAISQNYTGNLKSNSEKVRVIYNVENIIIGTSSPRPPTIGVKQAMLRKKEIFVHYCNTL